MQSQRYTQQNATKTQSASVDPNRQQQPIGQSRTIGGAEQRFEIRVDPAQTGVRAPVSRAQQLAQYVAQLQVETSRREIENVGSDLETSSVSGQSVSNRSITAADQENIGEALDTIDRARRQFSHAAAMGRKPVDQIQSSKHPLPTGSKAGIVTTISEAIAGEIQQAVDSAEQSKTRADSTVRRPFFVTATNDTTAPANKTIRPEVVFESERATAPHDTTGGSVSSGPENKIQTTPTMSTNGLNVASLFETTWATTNLATEPMTNHALRVKQDTDIVELPESLLREIADQHQQQEKSEELTDAVETIKTTESAPQPKAKTETELDTDASAQSLSNSISVELAAWDVDAFRWSEVSNDILAQANSVMDQLTHYCLDILRGAENRIAVTSLKRGGGSSTIASTVARWAVANNKRVLLVDADLGNPQLSQGVGLSPNVSWLNLIREDLIPAEAIIRSKTTGICVMPLAAVVTPQTWPGHLYDRLGGLIEQVRHGFDLILMDVGPIGQLSNELLNHQSMVDAVMIVDENPSSVEFLNAKSKLLDFGIRKFVVAQNSGADHAV